MYTESWDDRLWRFAKIYWLELGAFLGFLAWNWGQSTTALQLAYYGWLRPRLRSGTTGGALPVSEAEFYASCASAGKLVCVIVIYIGIKFYRSRYIGPMGEYEVLSRKTVEALMKVNSEHERAKSYLEQISGEMRKTADDLQALNFQLQRVRTELGKTTKAEKDKAPQSTPPDLFTPPKSPLSPRKKFKKRPRF